MPIDVAKELLGYLAKGSLEVLKAPSGLDVVKEKDQFVLLTQKTKRRFDVFLNATGLSGGTTDSHDLYHEIRREDGVIDLDRRDCSVVSNPRLYIVGAPTKGVFAITNYIRNSVIQAKLVSASLAS
ncbi:MAG: hypothetical protein Q4B17_03835 [Lautropia sp.]|nr:hypothetical protein [Lautropia sp.]